MSDPVRLATPIEFLPRYGCPFCSNHPLTYDAETDSESHETGATCDRCQSRWIVTATSTMSDQDTGARGGHAFTMRQVTE